WSPDGKFIAFASAREGAVKMYVKPADGSADERLLTDVSGTPTSWSRDGRFLLFNSGSLPTTQDVWVLPDPGRPAAESKPYALLASTFNEAEAQFSPDGRWIAYVSNESAPGEVYVRPFSATAPKGGGAKWLVSVGGSLNTYPQWSSTGAQLFF